MEAEWSDSIEAVVFSGRREGSFYVSIYAKNFRKALGFTPYPGTLNARITRRDHVDRYVECLARAKRVRVEPPRIPGARLGGVIVYRSMIMGVDAWIVRPDITHYKNDVVEFIAPVYLRKRLNLEDGSKITFRLALRV